MRRIDNEIKESIKSKIKAKRIIEQMRSADGLDLDSSIVVNEFINANHLSAFDLIKNVLYLLDADQSVRILDVDLLYSRTSLSLMAPKKALEALKKSGFCVDIIDGNVHVCGYRAIFIVKGVIHIKSITTYNYLVFDKLQPVSDFFVKITPLVFLDRKNKKDNYYSVHVADPIVSMYAYLKNFIREPTYINHDEFHDLIRILNTGTKETENRSKMVRRLISRSYYCS